MDSRQDVILSTGNINQKYKVKGVAHIETKIEDSKLPQGWANFKISEVYAKMNSHFVAAAKHFGGNAVININYSHLTLPNFDFIVIGYGTVVEIYDE
ncbi:MAG TPA: hypothetical protein PLM75_07810 [bacterium]|nr:hypothetical protein [bacterium]HPP87745.1 hypothetical protein [bacterium]